VVKIASIVANRVIKAEIVQKEEVQVEILLVSVVENKGI